MSYLSAETEGAASYGAAPSLILLQKTKSIDIGATDIEGVGGDCRHLAIVTLYPDRFFRKKFANLQNTPYLCTVKNKALRIGAMIMDNHNHTM